MSTEMELDIVSAGQSGPIKPSFVAVNHSALANPADAVRLIRARLDIVRAVRAEVMQENAHFGKIPGTDKPTLLQPGAQILCMAFGLTVHSESSNTRHLDGGHIDVEYVVTLIHASSGTTWATGVGSASTMESKHRWRNESRKCPNCGQPVFKSKFPVNGDLGWYCNGKRGGCGENYHSLDHRIVDQQVGKVENPDIADQYNTVRKMAWKRAFVAAVLTATAASEMFTQDMEDLIEPEAEVPRKSAPKKSVPKDGTERWRKAYDYFKGRPELMAWLKMQWHDQNGDTDFPPFKEMSDDALDWVAAMVEKARKEAPGVTE